MFRNISYFSKVNVLSGFRNHVSFQSNILASLATTQSCLISARGLTVPRKHIKKPLWKKIAASKLHYVPIRSKMPKEQRTTILERTRRYYTALKSLREDFRLDSATYEQPQEIAEGDDVPTIDAERMEFNKKITSEWNKKSAELRVGFELEIIKEQELKFETLLKEIEEAKAIKAENAKKHIENVMQERSKFIDMENLDALIEESLNKKLVFNFFIDKSGRRFYENLDGSVAERDEFGNPVVAAATEGSESVTSELETLSVEEALKEDTRLTEKQN